MPACKNAVECYCTSVVEYLLGKEMIDDREDR